MIIFFAQLSKEPLKVNFLILLKIIISPSCRLSWASALLLEYLKQTPNNFLENRCYSCSCALERFFYNQQLTDLSPQILFHLLFGNGHFYFFKLVDTIGVLSFIKFKNIRTSISYIKIKANL